MEYLHTMVRVKNIEESLDFYCDKLGLIEFSRKEVKSGRFTLVFLCAPDDKNLAEKNKKPLLELTYREYAYKLSIETFSILPIKPSSIAR